ncbi:MAG: hypothetical protein ACKOQS_13475 [Dolichospermum sp.]
MYDFGNAIACRVILENCVSVAPRRNRFTEGIDTNIILHYLLDREPFLPEEFSYFFWK